MTTQLDTIITNFAADNVPAAILESFRTEALLSGYDLATKAGTEWYTQRSTLADWFRDQRQANVVEFFWDYEDSNSGPMRNVYASGITVDGLQEFAQNEGLQAARRMVKRMAKEAGKRFVEVTDTGLARDYASARMIYLNDVRRA